MKSIAYVAAILGLVASAHASVLGLAPAASEPPQYYAVTITASPTVPITNAYFLYGNNYIDDNNLYSQNAYNAVPIGTLAAATSASPDVVTVDIPQLWFTDPAYAPQPVVPDRAGWSVIGLYTPGGVSISGAGLVSPDGGWPYLAVSESSVASELANGNVSALLNQYANEELNYTEADEWGLTEPMTDYSTATFNGNVIATINPTPVPEPTTATLALVGAVSLLRRRRQQAKFGA